VEYESCRNVSILINQQGEGISEGLVLTLSTIFFSVIFEIDSFERLESGIALGIAVFSILLLALSITAFKKTGLKVTIYAIIIFALFAIQQILEYLGEIFITLDTPIADVIISSMTLAILVLFFLAIVRTKIS
jgi:Na+/glutamate symporter